MVVQEGLDVVVTVEDREIRHSRNTAVLARCAAITIGIAAYDAAVERHPRDRVMLCHGARVLRDTHPEPREDYPGR